MLHDTLSDILRVFVCYAGMSKLGEADGLCFPCRLLQYHPRIPTFGFGIVTLFTRQPQCRHPYGTDFDINIDIGDAPPSSLVLRL